MEKYNFSDDQEFSLFTCYNYAIIANSTFSYMSSYLSKSRIISIVLKFGYWEKIRQRNLINFILFNFKFFFF